MHRVQAVVDRGATSIVMTVRLFKRLGISHQPANNITLAMTGSIMDHEMDSQKMRITVQYLDNLIPVDRSDVLVMPMQAYDLVLGLQWCSKNIPDTN
jgi:hypothetical protein